MCEYAWEPENSEEPLGAFAIDLLNEMQEFLKIHFGYGNLKHMYTYMDRWKKKKSDFKGK